MSGISQYQNVFRVAKREAPTQSNLLRPAKGKRNRQALSCVSCRTRKSVSSTPIGKSAVTHCSSRLKCDRQIPCTTCTKNGIESSCNYSRHASNVHERSEVGLRSSEAHLRLQKLEEMVTSLMQKTVDCSNGLSSEKSISNTTIEHSISTLSVEGSPRPVIWKSNSQHDYQGGTHWSTILENVRAILRKSLFALLNRSRFEIFKACSTLTPRTLKIQLQFLLQFTQIS